MATLLGLGLHTGSPRYHSKVIVTARSCLFFCSVFCDFAYSSMPPRNFTWFVKDRLAALGLPSTRADIEFLCSIGVKRLISLTESRPSLHGFPLTHVHIPIVDFTPPSIEQVNEFLSAVEKANSEEEVSVWAFNRT